MRVFVKLLSGRRCPVALDAAAGPVSASGGAYPPHATAAAAAAAAGAAGARLSASRGGPALAPHAALAECGVREGDTLHVLGERRLQEIVFLKPDGAKLRLADAALLGGESIAAVKRWLARDCKVPAARIEVLLGARRLEDDAQLWDYDVESGEMLRLSFRNATGDLDDLDDLDGSDLEGDDIDGSNSKVAAEALAQDFPAVLI